MIGAAGLSTRPRLDEPWRRLTWITPAAILLWAALLVAFALLLQATSKSPETNERLDARLIDLPAPAPPGGLQGDAEPAVPAAPPAPPPPQPQRKVEKKAEKPPVERVTKHLKKKQAAPRVYDASGAHTAPAEEVEHDGGVKAPVAAASGTGAAAASGGRGRGGLGADSIGARAIYAPPPKIPDDLRENVFDALAVAHFEVSYDGDVKVSLSQATSDPRLNAILLDTLRQWRFFPAIRKGIAVNSEFDVRIPIAVK